MSIYDSTGISELMSELEDVLKNVENTEDVLEIGAKEFVRDLLKLPKPKSKIRSSKHTHLVDTFTYEKSKRRKGEIEVGWGKYYGRMVEEGTSRMGRQPHFKPTFERNKEKYYKKMIKELGLD